MTIKFTSRITPGRPEDNAPAKYKLRSGRDRAQIVRWWNNGSDHKNYIDCSAAELVDPIDGCVYTLVWPHNYDTRLDVTWVAEFGTLIFTKFSRATRAALLCPDGTVLSHWQFGTRPGQKPTQYDVNDSCPDGCSPGVDSHCWTIPELPTIDTMEPKAPLSTSLFTICTDIPALPPLN